MTAIFFRRFLRVVTTQKTKELEKLSLPKSKYELWIAKHQKKTEMGADHFKVSSKWREELTEMPNADMYASTCYRCYDHLNSDPTRSRKNTESSMRNRRSSRALNMNGPMGMQTI